MNGSTANFGYNDVPPGKKKGRYMRHVDVVIPAVYCIRKTCLYICSTQGCVTCVKRIRVFSHCVAASTVICTGTQLVLGLVHGLSARIPDFHHSTQHPKHYRIMMLSFFFGKDPPSPLYCSQLNLSSSTFHHNIYNACLNQLHVTDNLGYTSFRQILSFLLYRLTCWSTVFLF